ncbi:hypothetical protein LCGC14_0687850 [marine sediment metagenome]|uniref:HNH nuclease domain-containing protein n=1 Tax=marine sediment metagenome TaxID=412755 RepID=A0A0F9QR67_9ZZZZ
MEKELKKINSLLNFYYNESVPIGLKIKSVGGLVIRGKIIKKNKIGMKYVVVKSLEKSPIKIFIEDIIQDSVVPIDYQKKENKNKRDTIPPAIRFKVLKRDRHTCTGCGARAPDVELEVDHIVPVSKGGTDELSNLRTLCKDCNIGKGNKV